MTSRHQRWLLQLQELDYDITYLKGKDNEVADFLSRQETAQLINKDNKEESNFKITDTKHSASEEELTYFYIKDDIVNKYKTQIIITYTATDNINIQHGRKIIEINPADTEIEIEQKLQNNLDKGNVGIFSEVPDSEYHALYFNKYFF